MPRPDQLRLLLVDDHPAIREAVRRRLEAVPRFQVVAEAGDIHGALTQIAATRPDLAVIDIGLGKASGLFLAREVRDRYPDTRVLIWSMHDNARCVAAARKAGACGYVLKSGPTGEIVRAIEVVAGGGCYYSAGLDRVAGPEPELTPREAQILRLVASGIPSSGKFRTEVDGVSSGRVKVACGGLSAPTPARSAGSAAYLAGRYVAVADLGEPLARDLDLPAEQHPGVGFAYAARVAYDRSNHGARGSAQDPRRVRAREGRVRARGLNGHGRPGRHSRNA